MILNTGKKIYTVKILSYIFLVMFLSINIFLLYYMDSLDRHGKFTVKQTGIWVNKWMDGWISCLEIGHFLLFMQKDTNYKNKNGGCSLHFELINTYPSASYRQGFWRKNDLWNKSGKSMFWKHQLVCLWFWYNNKSSYKEVLSSIDVYISAPLIYYNLLLASDLVISFLPEIYPKEIKMDEYI